jgi:inorganic pyrophosphatase
MYRFFEEYKVLENKQVKMRELGGSAQALSAVIAAIALYRAEENRLRGWTR